MGIGMMKGCGIFSSVLLLALLSGFAHGFGVGDLVVGSANAATAAPKAAANSITITNKSGNVIGNYPFQFGRPFLDGAIPNQPQVLINGQPVTTQADVKNRYPDGSVEFAVIAVVVPALPAGGISIRTFRNQTAGDNTPLTRAQILAFPGLGATMTLASPATMLSGVTPAMTSVTNGAFGMVVNGTPYQIGPINFAAGSVAKRLQAAFDTAGAPVRMTAIADAVTGRPRVQLRTTAAGPSASLAYATAPACAPACADISTLLGLTAATVGTGDSDWFPANTTVPYQAELQGAAQIVDMNAMLAAGAYTNWTSGQIAQTIAIADDSATRKYDVGFGDGHHPFRPRFYATFWTGTGQVFVRFVGENDITTELEDTAYRLTLGLGSPSRIVYTQDLTGTAATNPKSHWSSTRWSRNFWIGGTPPAEVNIDNNLAYLESTRFVPNFDTSVIPSQSSIAAEYTRYVQNKGDIYDGLWNLPTDSTMWTSGMGATG